MDYYQGVVQEYLSIDRSVFVNPEYLLQIDPRHGPPKGTVYWYVDILAIKFGNRSVQLCEVTYSRNMQALSKKLASFASHWDSIKIALERDAKIPLEWSVSVTCFVPEFNTERITKCAKALELPHTVVAMETIVPWIAKPL